jgi:hypothetical protein
MDADAPRDLSERRRSPCNEILEPAMARADHLYQGLPCAALQPLEQEPHPTPRRLPPMATRFLLKSPLPPRDRYRFLLGCEPASNCHGAGAQLMRNPLDRHTSGSQSARLLDALAVVAHPAAGATEARVTLGARTIS